ncbi:MAG: efflux RND transporter periplasmic adaptor subunit [Prolixibacteraceae bacterium]|nr:efflux RND transporter periplasmic adaptor subunit [Prolixibacteraceae bacterium]
MNKRGLIQTLLLVPALFLMVSCGGKILESKKKGAAKDTNAIRETGELAAVNSRSFPLPRFGRYFYEMRIIGLLEHGAIVEAGDSIIQLDPAEINRFILDREINLETQMGNLEKLRVDQSNTMSSMESTIKSQEASFALKTLELESARFETDRYKKIKELEFRQTQITLEKEKKKIEFIKIIQDNDLKIQELRIAQIKREIDNAIQILPSLTIRTPISGIFQIARNRRTNTLAKVGDDIYPGNNMANVPDINWMKVNTQISETDFLKIRKGQKVVVRLDALPEIGFAGEVTYIGKLCHRLEPNSKQKVFDVEVNVLQPDERLKPGMTVSCEFINE